MNNNAVAAEGRPSRTKSVPLRLQDAGESGAAAGHGVTQPAPAGAAQRAPSGMARKAVHSRVTPLTDTPQGVPPGAGLMPGFSDDAARQARQAAARKVIDDPRFGLARQKTWSSSESDDDDEGGGSPTSSGSSNVSAEDSSEAPSDIGSQSGDVVFEKEIREAVTGGGGARTRTNNHGKRKASAGGSGVGKKTTAAEGHRASAKKARGKDYPQWATHFLKRTCAHRKIPRMSQSSKDVLVAALRSLDGNMKRSSPYFDDLDAIAAGEMLVLCRFVVD